MNVKKKRGLKLGSQLKKIDIFFIATVSFLMIFVLILFGVYTRQVKTNEVHLIDLVLERMSINQKNEFEEYIDEKIQTLKGLTNSPAIYTMHDEEIKNQLRGKAKDFGFEYFFVMKTNGTGYYFDEGEVYREQKEEPFFQNIMDNEVYLTEPFYSDKSPAITTVCVSIRHPLGPKVGVLCAALDLRKVQELIENNEMVLQGNNFIIDKRGDFVVASKGFDSRLQALGFFNIPGSDFTLVNTAFNTKSDQAGDIVINGITYKSYISYLSDFNWVIVQSIPESEVTARFKYIDSLQQVITMLSVALLLCLGRIIYCWRKSDSKIYKDVLTGCHSRAACIHLLENLESKKKKRISIIYMDLNNFKFANDTYGHDEGDRLLRIFSSVLKDVLGSSGFVGRLGGDEFISIQVNTSDEELEAMCKKVEQSLYEKSQSLPYNYTISASYGYVSREPGDPTPLEDLLQTSDKNMYKNKMANKA